MEWIMLAIGAVGGLIIGYLFAERRARAGRGELEMSAGLAQQRCGDIERLLATECQTAEDLRRRNGDAEKSAAALAAQLESAQQNIAEQRLLLDEAQVKLKDAFATVSAEALAKNNEAFLALARQRFSVMATEAAGSLEQRKAQIEGLLKPMQELLGTYQTRVTEIEKSRVESYSMLREQLGTLAEAQRTLNTHTSQLITALSRPQARGRWGEVALRRLVELAGMTSRCDFDEQQSVQGEDGRLRPDMIVNLPGERQIIIDCKAILDAFLEAAGCADQDVRLECLKRHAQQVRRRLVDLSAKAYWSQFPKAPEFVVMFLPGEAFLYAAVDQDVSLIEDGFRARVIIATPTTLMALLRTVEIGWRQQEISENAEQIRKLGVDLYDRIATLAGHIGSLGSSIDSTVTNYNKMLGNIETRVLVSARKMGELGARTQRDLPVLEPVDSRPKALSIADNSEPA